LFARSPSVGGVRRNFVLSGKTATAIHRIFEI